jgi:hypothetical protein
MAMALSVNVAASTTDRERIMLISAGKMGRQNDMLAVS